ncbi:MAG: hypothetical protein H6636_08365 [Anaerolineales bacterium]|nr:hypothetical protein [Anaerolineales bacterium]
MMNSMDNWKHLGKLWIYWTAATTVMGALAYPLIVGLASLLGGWPIGYWVSVPVGGGLVGLGIGYWQKRMLRAHVQVPRTWVGMTGVGWGVGFGLVVGGSVWFLGYAKTMQAWYALTIYLITAGFGGALSGMGQFGLLKRRFEKAVWWLMACAVGSLLAWLVIVGMWYFLGQGADFPSQLSQFPAMLVLGGLAGWMMGMEQGVALVGLIAQEQWERERRSEPPMIEF